MASVVSGTVSASIQLLYKLDDEVYRHVVMLVRHARLLSELAAVQLPVPLRVLKSNLLERSLAYRHVGFASVISRILAPGYGSPSSRQRAEALLIRPALTLLIGARF